MQTEHSQEELTLLDKVHIGFAIKRTNLARFCRENNIPRANVYKIFNGEWNGKKGKGYLDLIIAGSIGQ